MLWAAAIALWELAWYSRRNNERARLYADAAYAAAALGRPLIVIGAPDRGATRGPGCGDVTIDIGPSSCPNSLMADVTKRLPFEENSVVVFVSCVLEYVDDLDAALAELQRVSGGWLFIVRVEPWTATAFLYPGAKRVLLAPNLPPRPSRADVDRTTASQTERG